MILRFSKNWYYQTMTLNAQTLYFDELNKAVSANPINIFRT